MNFISMHEFHQPAFPPIAFLQKPQTALVPDVGPPPDEELIPITHPRDPIPPQISDLQPSISTMTKLAHPVASANEVETLQNTIRFQKARIIALQEELDSSIKMSTQRDLQNQQLKEENKILREDAKKNSRSLQVGVGQNEKLKKNVALLEGKLKELERDGAEV